MGREEHGEIRAVGGLKMCGINKLLNSFVICVAAGVLWG